jgi:hypothetical protein
MNALSTTNVAVKVPTDPLLSVGVQLSTMIYTNYFFFSRDSDRVESNQGDTTRWRECVADHVRLRHRHCDKQRQTRQVTEQQISASFY